MEALQNKMTGMEYVLQHLFENWASEYSDEEAKDLVSNYEAVSEFYAYLGYDLYMLDLENFGIGSTSKLQELLQHSYQTSL